MPTCSNCGRESPEDFEIDNTVSLPEPCIAPIVFATSPTGARFAATGS